MYVTKLTKCNNQDAEAIGQLLVTLSQRFVGKPLKSDVYQEIIASPYHELFIVRNDEDTIVAMAAVSLTLGPGDGHKAYLDDFVVHPDYRGNGLAKKLWNAIVDWCREKDAALFFTSRSDDRRKAAREFYEHQGAQIIQDKNYYHFDPR